MLEKEEAWQDTHDIMISCICKQFRGCHHLCCYASVAFLTVAVFMRKIQLAIHNETDLANYLAHCLV